MAVMMIYDDHFLMSSISATRSSLSRGNMKWLLIGDLFFSLLPFITVVKEE